MGMVTAALETYVVVHFSYSVSLKKSKPKELFYESSKERKPNYHYLRKPDAFKINHRPIAHFQNDKLVRQFLLNRNIYDLGLYSFLFQLSKLDAREAFLRMCNLFISV